jgi:hypothetical protein
VQRTDGTRKNFISWERRRDILMEIPCVVDVVAVEDGDGTVCDALSKFKPDFFGNGGSRTVENTPEVELCRDLNIGTVWFLGTAITDEAKQVVESAIKKANGVLR